MTENFILECGHIKGFSFTQHARPGDQTKCFACPPKIDLRTGGRTAPVVTINRKAN